MDKMELRGTYTEYLPSYTVGIDAYQAVPHVTRYYGTKAVVIGGETAMSKAKDRLLAAIEGSPLTITDWICYGKQATHKRAHELAAMDQVKDADMIFAVGGRRAIDTSKEVATLVDKPCFTFPTLASNCAPVTRICVLYHEDGSADQYIIPQEPPIHSFLDTQIIVESPDEYFWAGVGDAFSKGAEVELSTRDVDVVHSPLMGRALAGQQSCIDPLLEYGAQAIADKHEHKPTDAFERVVMNIIVTAGLISNMTTNLGAERCPYYFNSSTAHAFYNGYTFLGEKAERHLHGEIVSLGVCVLYAFDANPEMLAKQVVANSRVGLPTKLADVECEVEDLDRLIEGAQTTNEWGRAPYGYSVKRFRQAILDADAYGRAFAENDAAGMEAALQAVRDHAVTDADRMPRKL